MESLYLLEYPSISIYNFRSRFQRWADTVFIFGVWLFNIMLSQFYPFTCKCHHSFFFMSAQNSTVCLYHVIFIYSSTDGMALFPSYCEQCSKIHGCTSISGVSWLRDLRYTPKRDITVSVSIFWAPLSWFPRSLHKFTFWSAGNKWSAFHIFYQIC